MQTLNYPFVHQKKNTNNNFHLGRFTKYIKQLYPYMHNESKMLFTAY